MDPIDVVRVAASQQHGFAVRYQARASGVSAKALRHLVGSGAWEAAGPRLLRCAGAPWTKASPLMRAVLDAGPGAVVSHDTAAAWWGLPGFGLRLIHVTRPRGLTGTPALFADVLHTVLDLAGDQVTVLDGVPIVRPERLIFELFATAHPKRAERAAETAWSKGLLSGRSLRCTHAELAERGRKGTVALREFLSTRPDDWVPPASGLEARVMHILAGAGLGRFRRQVDLGDDDRWVGRVDFLHELLPVVVEVQSERYHKALLDTAHDAVRRARLEAAGFVVVEVWDTEVWYERQVVVDKVRTAMNRSRERA